MSKNIDDIIGLFKSRTDVARAACVANDSTVGGWVARESIPHEKRLELLRNCEAYGVRQHALYGLLIKEYFDVLTGWDDLTGVKND